MDEKKLILFNGRGHDRNTHLYVAAYSRADAARMLAEIYGYSFNMWVRELTVYFSEGIWGTHMEKMKIVPERGVWVVEENPGRKIRRIYRKKRVVSPVKSSRHP